MIKYRSGVTFIELLTVFVIMGIIVGIGLPRFVGITERASVSAARDQVLAALQSARSAAVRRGSTATFYAAGNSIRVTVDSSGNELDIIRPIDLYATNRTTLAASGNASKIQYNMRGLASNASGKLRFTRGDKSDSVCVTTLGAAMKQGCL